MAQFKVAKIAGDQQIVFGWASVAFDADGQQLVDHQGDMIDMEDLEKAAYDHVLHFRSAGERHDQNLRDKGRLIESVVFTREKLDAMGIGQGLVPYGWWVGFKIDDADAWEKVKAGEYEMFSIEGKAMRVPVAKSFREAFNKFNPYHDERGRFATGASSVSFSASASMIATNAKVKAMMQYFADRRGNLQTAVGGTKDKPQYVKNGQQRLRLIDSSLGRAESFAPKTLVEIANIKVTTPDSAGHKFDWGSVSDEDFEAEIQKKMPGIDQVIKFCETNGLDSTHQYEDSGKNGDMVLSEICKHRGYHALPQIVDKAGIKAYMAQNNTPELYRGMGASRHGQSGSEKQDRFANDPLNFAGYGVLGNGTYAAQTPKGSYSNAGLRTARSYASHAADGSIRMTLKKGTGSHTYAYLESERSYFRNRVYRAQNANAITPERARHLLNICSDVGRFGALRGYKAWYDKGSSSGGSKGSPYWVLVDRGSMIIQKERYT